MKLLYYTWQVKGIMSQNMDLMMQRGEKLEHGLEKVGKLTDRCTSLTFVQATHDSCLIGKNLRSSGTGKKLLSTGVFEAFRK